jgi:hypothetical protein
MGRSACCAHCPWVLFGALQGLFGWPIPTTRTTSLILLAVFVLCLLLYAARLGEKATSELPTIGGYGDGFFRGLKDAGPGGHDRTGDAHGNPYLRDRSNRLG